MVAISPNNFTQISPSNYIQELSEGDEGPEFHDLEAQMMQAKKLDFPERPKSTKVFGSDGINNRLMRPVTSKARGASGK